MSPPTSLASQAASPGGLRLRVAKELFFYSSGPEAQALPPPLPDHHDVFISLNHLNPFNLTTPSARIMMAASAGDAALMRAYTALVDAVLNLHRGEVSFDYLASCVDDVDHDFAWQRRMKVSAAAC